MKMKPSNPVRNPIAVKKTINNAQVNIVHRFRNTALILETTAVTGSTSRLAMKGKEKTLAEKVKAANIDPTREPTPRKTIRSASSALPLDGKNTCTMLPALAQSRKITSSMIAKTSALEKGFRAAISVCLNVGLLPRHNCLLTEYKANADNGATKIKPDSMLSSKTQPPSFQAVNAMIDDRSQKNRPQAKLRPGAFL